MVILANSLWAPSTHRQSYNVYKSQLPMDEFFFLVSTYNCKRCVYINNDYFIINSFRIVFFFVPSSSFVLINASRDYLNIVRRTENYTQAQL